jgi:hypothetical protein
MAKMTEPLTFVIAALAVYRVSRFITTDTLFNPIRDRIWKRFPPETSKFGYWFTCTWCTSIWVASLSEISRIINPSITLGIQTVFALSALAGLLTAYEEK